MINNNPTDNSNGIPIIDGSFVSYKKPENSIMISQHAEWTLEETKVAIIAYSKYSANKSKSSIVNIFEVYCNKHGIKYFPRTKFSLKSKIHRLKKHTLFSTTIDLLKGHAYSTNEQIDKNIKLLIEETLKRKFKKLKQPYKVNKNPPIKQQKKNQEQSSFVSNKIFFNTMKGTSQSHQNTSLLPTQASVPQPVQAFDFKPISNPVSEINKMTIDHLLNK